MWSLKNLILFTVLKDVKLTKRLFSRLARRLGISPQTSSRDHNPYLSDKDDGLIRVNRAVLCRLTGGLANQMICYKFGRYVAEQYKRTLILDASWYSAQPKTSVRNLQLTHFNIVFDILAFSKPLVESIEQSHTTTSLCSGEFHDFANPETKTRVLQLLRDADQLVVGDIFPALSIRSEADSFAKDSGVLSELTLNKAVVYSQQETRLQQIIDSEQNSVAVHVRRGDFASHDGNILLTEMYFNRSIERLRDELRSPSFFIFSDDIEWCKTTLKSKNDLTFVDFNDERHGFKDMVLAASCKHFILSERSTYSHQIVELSRDHAEKIVIRSSDDDLARNAF